MWTLGQDEFRFIQFDPAGDMMGYLGSAIIGSIRELPEEDLEKARKKALYELKKNQADEMIVKRLGVFLEEVRNRLY